MWLQNELDAKCKHCPVADPDLPMGGGGGGGGVLGPGRRGGGGGGGGGGGVVIWTLR